MADTSSAQRPPARQDGQKTRRDFATLSRRMALWTTNGLATALVLVAGFALGRQVLVWWQEPPPQPVPAPHAPSDSAERQLEFGALATSMRTRTVRGNRAERIQQLADLCRPAGRPQPAEGDQVSAAERRLLADLARKTPLETGDGWRMDELGEQMPLVVCSTWVDVGPGGQGFALRVPLDLRIVSIAMAIPADEGNWSAYAFDVSGGAAAAASEAGPMLPPASRRVLALRQGDGSTLTTFRGLAEPAAWESHFRRLDPSSGWRLARGGNFSGGRWQGEFTRPGEKPLRATVHFEYDGQGWLHGLSFVTPHREP